MSFLRDAGKHFTVNYMLKVGELWAEGEDGISFTEFSHLVLQAQFSPARSPWLHTADGGTDQWGNITAGIDLIRKGVSGRLTARWLPMKTASGGPENRGRAIWLIRRRSPFKFYQFWLNTDDHDVVNYQRLTFLSVSRSRAGCRDEERAG